MGARLKNPYVSGRMVSNDVLMINSDQLKQEVHNVNTSLVY